VTVETDEILAMTEPTDLVKFGLIPELVGRMPVTTSLQELDRDAMVRILKEPRNSLIKQYQKLMELDGVDLTFTDDAIEAIADKAMERKIGARGLRSIMESTMRDVMYNVPSIEGATHVVINRDVVDQKTEAEIMLGDSDIDVKGA
jgi:ATP-dependent Clp protease ATP-binding subunit ClpX